MWFLTEYGLYEVLMQSRGVVTKGREGMNVCTENIGINKQNTIGI